MCIEYKNKVNVYFGCGFLIVLASSESSFHNLRWAPKASICLHWMTDSLVLPPKQKVPPTCSYSVPPAKEMRFHKCLGSASGTSLKHA